MYKLTRFLPNRDKWEVISNKEKIKKKKKKNNKNIKSKKNIEYQTKT
jgi:hypothetical protein